MARHFEASSDFWCMYHRDTNKLNTITTGVSALLPRGTGKECQYLGLEMPISSHAQPFDHRVLYFSPLEDMTATNP
jgi:hypothetical protein